MLPPSLLASESNIEPSNSTSGGIIDIGQDQNWPETTQQLAFQAKFNVAVDMNGSVAI